MIKSIVQPEKYVSVSGNGAYPYISSYGNSVAARQRDDEAVRIAVALCDL
jgi:hypothetical protein